MLPFRAKSQTLRARRTAWRTGASPVNRGWAKELRCAKNLRQACLGASSWLKAAGPPGAAKRLAGWRAFPKSFAAHDIYPPSPHPPTCPWRANSGGRCPVGLDPALLRDLYAMILHQLGVEHTTQRCAMLSRTSSEISSGPDPAKA